MIKVKYINVEGNDKSKSLKNPYATVPISFTWTMTVACLASSLRKRFCRLCSAPSALASLTRGAKTSAKLNLEFFLRKVRAVRSRQFRAAAMSLSICNSSIISRKFTDPGIYGVSWFQHTTGQKSCLFLFTPTNSNRNTDIKWTHSLFKPPFPR